MREKIDISSWPTKAEACQALNLSMSQVNNLVKDRKLEVRIRKRPRMPPVGVVNPDDLARELAARHPRPHVMPELPAEPAQPQNRKTAATDAPESFIWMLEAMLERVTPRLLPPPAPPPPGPANEPYLIDRKEIQGLGFTGDWLRKQVKAGKLHRFGRGKYSRFEFYRLIGKIV